MKFGVSLKKITGGSGRDYAELSTGGGQQLQVLNQQHN